MNKLYLVLVFTLLFVLSSNAQECATEVTKEQYEYLSNHKYFSNGFNTYTRSAMNMVPVQVHILRTSEGKGGLATSTLKAELEQLNVYFKPAKMQFYMSGPINYIDNDNYYNFNQNDEQSLAFPNDVSNVINIYYVNELKNKIGSTICGYSYMPGGLDRVFISKSCTANGVTLAHEIGHYFSLYHTHGISYNQKEYADGSNCEDGGDEVCDTPADPNLSGLVNQECSYVGSAVDPNGTAYSPDTKNIMSYALGNCRNHFTAGQYDRMLFSYLNDRIYLSSTDTFSIDFNELAENKIALSLYPNPSNGFVNLLLNTKPNEPYRVAVYDVTGRMVYAHLGDPENYEYGVDINLSRYEKGVYVVQVIADNRALTERIIYH